MSGSNFVTLGPVPDSVNDGIQRIQINATGQVQNTAATIVPASAGKRIFVHQLTLAANNNNHLIISDLTTVGATVTNQMLLNITASQPVVLPYCQYPYFTAAIGDAVCIDNGTGTINFFGQAMYVQG